MKMEYDYLALVGLSCKRVSASFGLLGDSLGCEIQHIPLVAV